MDTATRCDQLHNSPGQDAPSVEGLELLDYLAWSSGVFYRYPEHTQSPDCAHLEVSHAYPNHLEIEGISLLE